MVITVGGVPVPVMGEPIELTGTNVQNNPNIGSFTAYELWEAGTDIGRAVKENTTGTTNKFTEAFVPGGRISLIDSGELVVSAAYDGPTGDPGAKGKVVDWNIIHYSGETAEDFNHGTVDIVPGQTGGQTYMRYAETECRWTAVAYKYTNSTLNDNQKVMNYKVYATFKSTTINTSSGSESVSYDQDANPILISLAYWNGVHNTFLRLEGSPDPDPDEPPFDPSTPMDYDPVIDDTSDLISIPSDPTIGISNAGWVHVYSPSTGGLVNFGAWLFPNPELPSSADPTEIVNYLLLLCQTLANSRLIDYILDCHIIPVSPQVGSSQDIKVGGRTAVGISAPVVTSDYINVSCGSLNIHEYFSGFQDYITTAHLYLPFIGFVDVLPEYWQSGTISVDYKFNVIDGSFMVYIRSASSKSQLAGSVIAQYSGNACMHIPITGINYSNMVSGLVGAAVAAQGGKTASSVLGSAYSAANTLANGGTMVQSNGYNSTAAMLGVRYPYLCIERPVPSIPARYARDKGYPTNITTALSGVTGFTTIEDIDLFGIPLTQGELEELRGLLKEGVYF